MAMTKEKQARKRAKIRQNPIKHSAIKDKDKLRKAQARAASKASMSGSQWLLYHATKNAQIKKFRSCIKAAKVSNVSKICNKTVSWQSSKEGP